MKNEYETDRLLNGYIDGELSPREQIEVKRLIDHDKEAAERLKILQKGKLLLQSLPEAKAPAGILQNAMARLNSPQEEETATVYRPKYRLVGVIQLFLRKSIAAAALFLVVCGLGIMIYYIVSPPQKSNIAKGPGTGTAIGTSKGGIVEPLPVQPVFTARLELKAKTPETQAAIEKLLKENFAANITAMNIQPQAAAYVVSCTSDKIASLTEGLQFMWQDFTSERLVVDTDTPGNIIVVDNIQPKQFADILIQNNLATQLKAAGYYAFLNNINKATQPTTITPGMRTSNPNDIPIPYFAGKENPKAATAPPLIHLTIEISFE